MIDFAMSTDNEKKYRRIRRLKKIMRPLPRRSNIHRYPVLKWFSNIAYQRSYLWSFRSREMIWALFIGMWVAMLPIVSIQMIVVFLIALIIRANLPVIVALQWISNPFTMGPIYFADYKIGMEIFRLLGISYKENRLLRPDYEWSNFSYADLLALLDTFPPMMVGGSVIGIFLGVLSVFLYKISCNLYKIQNDY